MLLDQNTSEQLVRHLHGHQVGPAKDMYWDELRNGALIVAAQSAGFEVLLTTDQNLWYQQNNSKRQIALVVCNTNRLAILRQHIDEILSAIERATTGSYEVLELVPSRRRKPRRG